MDDLLRGLLLRGRHHQVVDIRAHGLRALSALSAQVRPFFQAAGDLIVCYQSVAC